MIQKTKAKTKKNEKSRWLEFILFPVCAGARRLLTAPAGLAMPPFIT
jgi:hypothetical protein